MMTRTLHRTVHLAVPATLEGLDRPLPPGDYGIDEDEELIEGLSWLAYRRVATFITIPASAGNGNAIQVFPLADEALEAILRNDPAASVSPERKPERKEGS